MKRAQHLPGPDYDEPPLEPRETWEERQERLDQEGDDAYERDIEREQERKREARRAREIDDERLR